MTIFPILDTFSSSVKEGLQRISIRELAARLHLGKSTVSYALRGNPMISRATRERVLKAAQDLGYVKDPVVSRMASARFDCGKRRSHVPVAIICEKQAPPLESDYRQALKRLGYSLEFFSVNRNQNWRPLLRMLYHRGFEGVLITRIFTLQVDLDLDWEQFVVLSVGAVPWGTHFHRISSDYQNDSRLCWKKAVGAGYRRIGVVLPRHDERINDDIMRETGIMIARAELPEGGECPQLQSGFDPDVKLLGKWLEKERPDCVIGHSAGTLNKLEEAGFSVPEDVAFVGMRARPQDLYSGVRFESPMYARLAAEHFDSLYRHNRRGIPDQKHLLLTRSTWRDGNTLPAKSGTEADPVKQIAKQRMITALP